MWLRLPVLQTEQPRFRAGDGVGLDVGFQWEAEPWQLGLSVQNVINTFGWDVNELIFRPGSALFTQDDALSDFQPRPAAEAPDELLDAVRDFRFGPRVRVGSAKELVGSSRQLTAQADARLGVKRGPEPAVELGAALQYAPLERLPLRAHASVLNWRIPGRRGRGLRLRERPPLGWTLLSLRRHVNGPEWMVAVSLGWS